MFKELLLAVVLGALLGFGITGGIIALKNSKSSSFSSGQTAAQPTSPNTITTKPQPSDNPSGNSLGTNNHQITIDSPENESIVTNSKVTVKGSTSPQSTLVITTPSKSYFATADNAGNFNVDIDIDSGVNQVQIDSIDPQDDQATTQLIITYSTANI
jgi:cytoskeletal protein RodZ